MTYQLIEHAENTKKRSRLPNRRPCETITCERSGSLYHLTIGSYPNGKAGEVFLDGGRSDSLLAGADMNGALRS
jgi:hypothetical protein